MGPLALPATANAQLTASANEVLKRTQTFYQNGSATYNGGSTGTTFPTNFTAGNYTSINSFTESFKITSTGGFYPQANLTQAGVLLANTTVSVPFTLAPTFSASPVASRVAEMFSATGAVPSNGQYTVTSAATQAVNFVYSTPLNWTANASSSFNAVYSLAAYRGYWLNQSQVYLPFPSISTGVNWSTVAVTINGSAYHNFQVVTGGIYVNVASVGPGYTASLGAKFIALPAISGAAPVLVVTSYAVLNATYYQLNTSWTNELGVAYAGTFLIQTRFVYTIDPTTVTVIAGLRTLAPSTWTLQGDTLEILPLVVNVPSGSAISFFVNFRFANAPPISQVSASTVAFGLPGGVSVTWGQTTLGLAALLGTGAVVGAVLLPRVRRSTGAAGSRSRSLSAPITLGLVAVVLLVIWYLLTVAGGPP